MKIPETSANIGAYYGNEENGQWQPNGVIIDSGVGGGVVGSGDAGIHRPAVYPVHIPRSHQHIPGYVMAGAYYPPGAYPPPAPAPAPQDDFADYMWMENEEEFDKQVMQQLEEEALMEQCIEAMLEDEQRERHRPQANGHNNVHPTTSNGYSSLSLEETVSRSTLNPLAAEFVPTRVRQSPPQPSEEKQESPPEVTAAPAQEPPQETKTPQVEEPEAPSPSENKLEPEEESKPEVVTEVPTTPADPPEVSAADLERKPKEKKDAKKAVKPEPKKKAAPVRSETKVPPKKRDPKAVKSDVRVEDKEEEPTKPQVSPAEEPAQTGPKPINYAAAAKANKPKKPTTPPATIEKTPPPQKPTEKTLPPQKSIEKTEKSDKKPKEKVAVKTEKPVQRKNSTK